MGGGEGGQEGGVMGRGGGNGGGGGWRQGGRIWKGQWGDELEGGNGEGSNRDGKRLAMGEMDKVRRRWREGQ